MRILPPLSFVVTVGLLAVQAPAQEKKDPPKPLYETRAVHDPNGIGKFYMGREIAHVMGWQGAGWLERPEREREEAVSKLMPALEVQVGSAVADFGAGSGHHAVRLSRLVAGTPPHKAGCGFAFHWLGERGKVYAVDIQKEMLAIMDKRFKQEKITNVTLVLGAEKDPKLPAKSIDMILMVDVYHELTFPYEVTVELVKALKPGGRLVFVEFRLEDPKVRILDVHRMSIAQVMKEMAPHAQMKHQKTLHHLPWQHVILFEKVAEKEAKKVNE